MRTLTGAPRDAELVATPMRASRSEPSCQIAVTVLPAATTGGADTAGVRSTSPAMIGRRAIQPTMARVVSGVLFHGHTMTVSRSTKSPARTVSPVTNVRRATGHVTRRMPRGSAAISDNADADCARAEFVTKGSTILPRATTKTARTARRDIAITA